MAYRFNITTQSYLTFNIGPFVGTLGAMTWAYMWKRNGYNSPIPLEFTGSGHTTLKTRIDWIGASAMRLLSNLASNSSSISNAALNDDTNWIIFVITTNGTVARFHWNKGSGWTHSAADSGNVASTVIGATDEFNIGIGYNQCDLVCSGIKKSDTSDLAVEALSLTSFPAWQAFNFDWLVGMQTIAALTNQGVGSGANEVSRGTGVSLAADPPGWSWVPVAAPKSGLLAFV